MSQLAYDTKDASGHEHDALGRFGKGGGKATQSTKSLDQKRDAVFDAMNEIANGKPESTIADLRDDLEEYGGTNDVTIKRGDEKSGLTHIAGKHGSKVIPGVLEAVIDGEIIRFSRGNKTIALQKDGYEAILSLDEHGKKKTWLLTGYDLFEKALDEKSKLSGESGKVRTRHAPTQSRPILSRPELGADSSFTRIIAQIFRESRTMVNPETAQDDYTIFDGLFDEPGKSTPEKSTSADMIRRLEKAQRDYKLQHVFREAAAQVQYFGGCLIYIGFPRFCLVTKLAHR